MRIEACKKPLLQSGDVASWQQNDVIQQEIQQDFLWIPVLGAPTDSFNFPTVPEHWNSFVVSVLSIKGKKTCTPGGHNLQKILQDERKAWVWRN